MWDNYTYSFSAGGGVFLVKACLLMDEGKSAKEIVAILESLKGEERRNQLPLCLIKP